MDRLETLKATIENLQKLYDELLQEIEQEFYDIAEKINELSKICSVIGRFECIDEDLYRIRTDGLIGKFNISELDRHLKDDRRHLIIERTTHNGKIRYVLHAGHVQGVYFSCIKSLAEKFKNTHVMNIGNDSLLQKIEELTNIIIVSTKLLDIAKVVHSK